MNTNERIRQLTERYMAGLTTLAEERELRSLRGADEARAVSSWARMQPRRMMPRTLSWPRRVAAAAAVAVAVGAAVWFTRPADEAVVYAQGRAIHSEELALAQMQSALSDISRANAAMDAEVDQLFNSLNVALQ